MSDNVTRLFAGAGRMSEKTAGQKPRTTEEPAHTITGKATAAWIFPDGRASHLDPELPATTVAGGSRLFSRDHHEVGGQARRATNVTLEEAAALQTFPPDFNWDATLPNGRRITKGDQHQVNGNAVPPLLAKRILEALWAGPANEMKEAA